MRGAIIAATAETGSAQRWVLRRRKAAPARWTYRAIYGTGGNRIV
jgi:hypothetical protein